MVCRKVINATVGTRSAGTTLWAAAPPHVPETTPDGVAPTARSSST